VLTRLQRAVLMAFLVLIAWEFWDVGSLALLLTLKLSFAHDPGAAVAGFASSVFIYVGVLSLRLVRDMSHLPFV
jgi:hypothetical protein